MDLKKGILIFFCLVTLHCVGQDTLIDIYGKQYIGTVVESGNRYLDFKTGDKILAFPNESVGIIRQQNGIVERFNWNRYRSYTDTHIPVENFKQNVLAINVADFAFANLTVSYERIFKRGFTSIKIPVSVGLNGQPDLGPYTGEIAAMTFMKNKNYSAGFELNYYPLGQTRHNYYIGISTLAGSFFYYPGVMHYSQQYNYQVIDPGSKKYGLHYSGMIHLGGNLGIAEHFTAGLKIAMGYKREETLIEDYTRFNMEGDATLAYKF